jgi:hypothetical protein
MNLPVHAGCYILFVIFAKALKLEPACIAALTLLVKVCQTLI